MGSSVTGLRAVALLVLLAGSAPAGIVAPDLVPVARHPLLGRDGAAPAAHLRHGPAGPTAAGRRDRIGARQRLVLVREAAAVDVVRPAQLLRLLRLELRVEEEHQHLLADQAAELLEHRVPLGAVLDKRVLLREGAEVDTLAEVIHVLEVLAPAGVDELTNDVALDLARDLFAPLLLLLAVE